MATKLYLVSTPIGNYDDITLRALNVLKEADIIICEEFKPAGKLLRHYDIKKEMISVNEHNEQESAFELALKLRKYEKVAMISDAGTPLFSDPGNFLIPAAISTGIEIIPVPGANSLLPAITGSGFNTNSFYYLGWLSPKKEERRRQLSGIKRISDLIVIMETPYRLIALLKDVVKILGPKTEICVAYKLTMPQERFLRGFAEEVLKKAEASSLKGEFVLLVNNRK